MRQASKALAASIAAAAALAPGFAFAESIANVAGNVSGNFQAIADLISGGAYLLGAGFGVKAALKLKEHQEQPQQTKLSSPLMYGLVAGALLALPTFLTVGSDTAFSGGGTRNTLGGGVIGH